LAIVCPITNSNRSFPFHVALSGVAAVTGYVMVEQVKSIDFRARGARHIGRAPAAILDEVLSILDVCLYS